MALVSLPSPPNAKGVLKSLKPSLIERADRMIKGNHITIIVNNTYSIQELTTKSVINGHEVNSNHLLAPSIKNKQDQTTCQEKSSTLESLDHIDAGIKVKEVDELLGKKQQLKIRQQERKKIQQERRRNLAETLKKAQIRAGQVCNIDLNAQKFTKKQEKRMKSELQRLNNGIKQATLLEDESNVSRKHENLDDIEIGKINYFFLVVVNAVLVVILCPILFVLGLLPKQG